MVREGTLHAPEAYPRDTLKQLPRATKMANNRLLGCWGFVVGALVTVAVGWMTFELFIAFLAGLRIEGLAAFVDPLLWHKAGELMIVGLTILGIYVWVFRDAGIARFAATTRYVFWFGAALNLIAWIRFPAGVRWSWWAISLVVLGLAVPAILSRLAPAAAQAPPAP